ncbi:MAG: hypothetical protein MJ234_02665 [bacterium]|nr:hypothetical protein [bacterium]
MLNAINPAARGIEQLNNPYSVSAGGTGRAESCSEALRPEAVTDMVDVDGIEQAEEDGSPDVQALVSALSQSQGFDAGIQQQFAMNSSSGAFEGLEQGIQPGGVFMPPYQG